MFGVIVAIVAPIKEYYVVNVCRYEYYANIFVYGELEGGGGGSYAIL